MALTTTFVGLDEDAVGEGDTTETIVVDTWLQQRIQINNEALLTPAVGVCFSPISGSANDFTSYTGIRPYCSFKWHTIWWGDVVVYKDQTHLEITLAYHAEVPGSSTDGGTIYIGVMCDDGTNTTQTGGTTLADTYSAGTTTGHQTITLELSQRVEQTRIMRVLIATRSDTSTEVATTIGSGGNGQTSVLYHEYPYRFRDSTNTGTEFFSPNSTGSPPDGNSLEAMYMKANAHTGWPDQNAFGRKFDLLYTADIGAPGTVAGTLTAVVNANPAAVQGGTMLMHQCLMLRAIFIRPVFGSIASPSPESQRMDRLRIAPIIEFGSGEAMEQAGQVEVATLLPTIAAMGPRGRVGDSAFAESDLDAYYVQGYPAHWPTIMGDFDDSPAGQGEHTDLINEGIWLRTENPRLEIRCTWLSVQHGAQWDLNLADAGRGVLKNTAISDSDKRKMSGDSGKLDTGLQSGLGAAEWTLIATVEQLSNATGTGDWATDVTTYGSATEGKTIPVYGADAVNANVGQPPVLRGIDSMVQTNKSPAAGSGFWFREGSLFSDDMQLFTGQHHTTTEIELAGLTETEVLKPLRLKLKMELSDFVDPVKPGDSTTNINASLRLMLVSYTVIEHPVKP